MILKPWAGLGVKRRGRDLNPRRTKPPETVFETAAFDRSATPPTDLTGTAYPGTRAKAAGPQNEAEKEGFEPSMEVSTPITP